MIVKDFNDRYEPIPSVAIVYWFPTHIQISVSYLQPLIFIAWIKYCISYSLPCVARLDSVLGKEIMCRTSWMEVVDRMRRCFKSIQAAGMSPFCLPFPLFCLHEVGNTVMAEASAVILDH